MKALHLFCGLGGGALGFQRAGFESVGAFDFDAAACRDFEYLTGEPATVADLATLSPDQLRAGCSSRPDVVFTSPPCKAFSGCLPEATSKTEKYQDMSSLALRGVWLALEAWRTPPPLVVLENVPRIMSRGRQWLDQVTGLLQGYGYAVRESTHDCGELGGLAQRRRRFLLVARHVEQVPEVLYEPKRRALQPIGAVLEQLPVPLPGSSAGGPMHSLPRLSALNWLRLALIPAGGDWRDLPDAVAMPRRAARQNGGMGVNDWADASHAVVAEGSVRNTWASIADPRLECSPRSTVLGVGGWSEPSATVIGAARHDNGSFALADPRVTCERHEGSLGITGWDSASTTIIGSATHHNGPWQVADPRLQHAPRDGGHEVQDWAQPSHTIIGDARVCKGSSVADPRIPSIAGPELDLANTRPTTLVIRAADGTWHRPLSTLELAALQGFPTWHRGDWLKLDGESHKEWRQRIGNAVPPPAAEAIARECRKTLEAARAGRLHFGSTPTWVSA